MWTSYEFGSRLKTSKMQALCSSTPLSHLVALLLAKSSVSMRPVCLQAAPSPLASAQAQVDGVTANHVKSQTSPMI